MAKGFVVWLTGLPGSGKTAIAQELSKLLSQMNHDVEVLDGDEVRQNLSKGAGFTKGDREAHALRVAYVAKLLAKHRVAVIVALISPYRSFRAKAREMIGDFVEVYVKCSLETCMRRDPKGLYSKAKTGGVELMTGIDDPYEEPLSPEVIVDTESTSPEESAKQIVGRLKDLNYLHTDSHFRDSFILKSNS